MRILKVTRKVCAPAKNSLSSERKVPALLLSGNWLTTELGVQPGDKVRVVPDPANPNALIIERVLL